MRVLAELGDRGVYDSPSGGGLMCTRSGGGDTSWTDGVGEWGTACMDAVDGCHSWYDLMVAMTVVSLGSRVMAGS